jgi:TonB family protein
VTLVLLSILVLRQGTPGGASGLRVQQEPPRLESSVLPIYPVVAITAGIQGTVTVDAAIAADGTVAGVVVRGESKALEDAAADALRQWRFAPGAAERSVAVTVRFVLSDAPPSIDTGPVFDVGWPPTDFAIFYRFECPQGAGIVTTLRAEGGKGQDDSGVLRLTLSPEEQVSLSLTLVQAGFFAAPAATTEREQRPGIRVTDSGVEVLVTSQRAHADSMHRGAWHHELMARTYGVWRILRWNQPVANDDQQGREAARIGEAVRDFIRSRVQDRSQREALGCRS